MNHVLNSTETETEHKQLKSTCDIAIIGAGPYGLSAGVHLKAKGHKVRVFGEPMEFWATKMPEGMLLRSPRIASNLSDPDGAFTLEAYEAAVEKQPSAPLPLDTFVEYGKWFRHQLGSDLDRRNVKRVARKGGEFTLTLESGEEVGSRSVVVAAGIGPFKRKPDVFNRLSGEHVVHCYEGRDVGRYAGKRVAVIGAGQSALESAALLHEAKASVEIIARRPGLRWIGQHTWLHHMGPISSMLYSKHDIGPLGISRLVAYPKLTRLVPLKLRDKIRRRAVRAAGSRWLPARLSEVKITTGRFVTEANAVGREVTLRLDDGSLRKVDHILLGTGYSVDISLYEFLTPDLLQEIRQYDGYPKLKSGFRSSVPGLHFVGATAARTFGPLLYFVAGTDFASRELASYFAKSQR